MNQHEDSWFGMNADSINTRKWMAIQIDSNREAKNVQMA